MNDARPRRTYRPGRWASLENTVMRTLARAGLVPYSWVLITRGRKSGLARSVPVVLVELDGRRWLVAPYGVVSWVHNARTARAVSLRHGRDRRDYAIREVGPDEAAPVLKRYIGIARATRPYLGAIADSPVEDFIAEAEGRPVFELTPLSTGVP